MFSRSFIKTKKTNTVEIGSLLIAKPFWQDEKYMRSVIIILDHNERESTGIIVNKLSTIGLQDALPELGITPPLYYGGPFNIEMISFFHNNQTIPESVFIANGLLYGGNYEYLKEMIRNRQINMETLKFFAGFVKWTDGQLEAEIAEDKWWTSELSARELFATAPEELWMYELLSNGHIYGILNEFPDPSLN